MTVEVAERIARRLDVFGQEVRVRLVYALHEHGERPVGKLAGLVGVSVYDASQHLSVLRSEGIVRRAGARAVGGPAVSARTGLSTRPATNTPVTNATAATTIADHPQPPRQQLDQRRRNRIGKCAARLTGCSCVGHTVISASVGDSRAARIAGSSPAVAPIRIAEAIPPAHASVGITTAQCLVWA